MLDTIEEILFRHLVKEREKEERAPSLLEGKLHANASSAGGCARAIGFRVAGVEPSTALTGDALFNFRIGDQIHDTIQTAMLAAIPGAEKEINGVIEDFITCRADLKYPAEDGQIVCTEIKSVSDFAYKLATGAKLKSNGQWNKKDQKAEGPKREHILQVGISAKSINAAYLCIIYTRKTAAKDEPIIAEWRFRINELDDKITAEIIRLKSIVQFVIDGKLPPREYEGSLIFEPLKTRWPCGYCSYLTACSKMESGVISLNPSETKT